MRHTRPALLLVLVLVGKLMISSRYLIIHEISEAFSLLVNGLTGAVDIVDRRTGVALKSRKGAGPLDPALRQKLLARGHLFLSEADEKAIVEKVLSLHAPKRRMLRFSISPTYSCNLRCAYCFEKDRVAKGSPVMSIKDVDLVFAAIDSISSGESNLPKMIALFGGEPLLPCNRLAVRRVLELASERAFPVSIATNGVNGPSFEEELRAFASSLKVQVTLDGPQEIHDERRITAGGGGTYNAVVRSVNLLLDLGIPVNLRINVDSQNLPYLGDMAHLVGKFGWPDRERFACNLSPVVDHTRSGGNPYLMEEWELLGPIMDLLEADASAARIFNLGMFRSLSHLKAVVESGKSGRPWLFYCEANNLEAFEFGPDGFIYACSECMGSADYAIGRYRPDFALFEDKASQWGKRNVATIEKCRSCELAFICGGGCAYSALAVNDSLYEPYCGSIRKLIDTYLERIGDKLIVRTLDFSRGPTLDSD
ncbi:MAG: radical SAM protein [Actinobacteria bacterium]|nr:radical SAM protein [Actinomycetota bacterium]